MVMRVAGDTVSVLLAGASERIRTDITPYGGYVLNISIPDDRVDEVVQAAQAVPNHIHASPGVPCF